MYRLHMRLTSRKLMWLRRLNYTSLMQDDDNNSFWFCVTIDWCALFFNPHWRRSITIAVIKTDFSQDSLLNCAWSMNSVCYISTSSQSCVSIASHMTSSAPVHTAAFSSRVSCPIRNNNAIILSKYGNIFLLSSLLGKVGCGYCMGGVHCCFEVSPRLWGNCINILVPSLAGWIIS